MRERIKLTNKKICFITISIVIDYQHHLKEKIMYYDIKIIIIIIG